MQVETYVIRTFYLKVFSEKKFPSSGYKIEAIPSIKRVKLEIDSKLEKDANQDFSYVINFNGKIRTPLLGSVQTRAFTPALYYAEMEPEYKNVVLVDKDGIVRSIISLDEEGNVIDTKGKLDIDNFEVI